MMRTLPLILALLFWASGIAAQGVELPALTGRVVDQAELLDTQAEARLTSMLAAHEQASGEQVVVVTVPNLQGRSIEEFGVELGREWGIGQKDEDTGALLIVARDERLRKRAVPLTGGTAAVLCGGRRSHAICGAGA